jgi:polyhydroxybutyrate depolymerase
MRKSIWRGTIIRALAVFAFASIPWASLPAAEMKLQHLSVGGLEREYVISAPAPASQSPRPTIVVLHGTWQSAQIMIQTTGLEPLVDREGLVAVYPNGIAAQWNDGRAAAAVWGPRDDVAFLRALVAHLVRTGVSDPHRVYVIGFSNGGMMALRMMCEATEVFAAIAAIGASLPAEVAPGCKPAAATPVLLMNGTADPFVPFEGGQVVLRGGVVLSTDQTIRFLRNVNGCDDGAQLTQLPDINHDDGSRVVITSWTDAAIPWPRCRALDSPGPGSGISTSSSWSAVSGSPYSGIRQARIVPVTGIRRFRFSRRWRRVTTIRDGSTFRWPHASLVR